MSRYGVMDAFDICFFGGPKSLDGRVTDTN